jgi:hypothetical protein
LTPDGEDAEEIRVAVQAMRGLRKAACVAQEMAVGLGTGEVLF